MKLIRVTSTAAALLVLGAILPAYGQHDENQKKEEKQEKPQPQHSPEVRQENQHAQPQARPQNAQEAPPQKPPAMAHSQQQQQRAQPATQARQEPQRSRQQAQTWQQQKGWAQHGGGSVGHATFAQSRSVNWSSDHRTWAQRGGYGGYYIPQAQFSLSFGTGHAFRLGGQPNMYMGYPEFAYGGYSFLVVDPWPSDWPGNWYSADDVYVGYDDGYYLYNQRFPQERLAITIAL